MNPNAVVLSAIFVGWRYLTALNHRQHDLEAVDMQAEVEPPVDADGDGVISPEEEEAARAAAAVKIQARLRGREARARARKAQAKKRNAEYRAQTAQKSVMRNLVRTGDN